MPSIVPENSFQPTGQMKTQVEELERLPSEVTLKTKGGDSSKEKVGTQVEELERQFSEVTIKLEETTKGKKVEQLLAKQCPALTHNFYTAWV